MVYNDLTTPLSGMIFHSCASTCYDHPIYEIWSLYGHPLRRYERRYRISKMRWFGVVRGQRKSLKISPFDRAHTSSYNVPILHRLFHLSFTPGLKPTGFTIPTFPVVSLILPGLPSQTIARTFITELLDWIFVFNFSLFFVSLPCARLSWPSRQLLSACKSTVSYYTGTYPPAPVAHSEWVCGSTLFRRLPLPDRRWWVGCINLWLTLSRWSTSSCSSASKVANRMMSSA